MTIVQQRKQEFYNLYNITDLFPFFKLKDFWNKINLVFFCPKYKPDLIYILYFNIKKTFNKIMLYIQKLKPV